MANVPFTFSTTGTAAVSNLFADALDRQIEFELRAIPTFREIATKKASNLTNPGETVIFQFYQDLALATTPLEELSDPDSVVIGNTTKVPVELHEYGNHAVVTKRAREFSIATALESDIANILAYNQATSVDSIIANVLVGTDNNIVQAASGGAVSIVSAASYDPTVVSNGLTSKALRFAVAKLRGANVIPFSGTDYVAYAHPEVLSGLMSEIDAAGWRAANTYVNTSNILRGEVGTYEGVRFVSSTLVPYDAVNGVYTTFLVGKDALAEAVAEEFHTVTTGTIVDALDRNMSLGWYGIAGWGLYRPEALFAIKTVSTLGA